ncbi:LCP family protein [Leucobacter sp. M11]|nr:LCP family protein [Leucobacter sp. M11]
MSITAVLALVLGVAVVVWAIRGLNDGIVRSEFDLPDAARVAAEPGEQNVLIMGLDSRVDQNGEPLPDGVYEALHAGGADDGGYNANVLMLLHIPEDRSKTVGISIPRDDYVELPGAPLGVSHAKIKEAYGLALQERMNELLWGDAAELSDAERYQQARAAGRQAQIETVSQFLGDVRIDHFVEMTMGGFIHVAEAVAPISVCLNQATEDSFSGADFVAGVQELDAEQAMSFVRQRRDTGVDGPALTDLDRARRQQALLVSLTDKLRQRSTLLNPKTVWSLVDTTRTHVALDADFDVLGFLEIAHEVSQSGVTFLTLPIVDFGMIDGASVNLVDVEEIQRIVAAVLDGDHTGGHPDQPGAAGPADADAEAEPGAQPDAELDREPEAWAEAEAAPGARPGEAADAGDPAPPAPPLDPWAEPLRAGTAPCVN